MRMMRVSMAAVLAAAVLLVAGCGPKAAEKVEPKIAPPAVATAGVIVVGVDLSTPPFAGVDEGKQAGYDIDVASALADRLGLTVKLVDVKPSDAATALAQGTADAVMSVPLADGAALTQLTLAGSYLDNGPALFISTGSTASVEPSLTLDTIGTDPIAVQSESESFWYLRSELDSESIEPYDSLRAAIEALNAEQVTVVAGDAIVGGYIARDFPNIHLAGQLKPAQPLAVAVAAENAALSDAIRAELDGLAADGVLDALRRKWVGALPELMTGTSTEESATPSAEDSPTP